AEFSSLPEVDGGDLPWRMTAATGRRMKSILIAAALVLSALAVAAESTSGGVVIKVEPTKVTRRTFDRQNPPAEMPKLTPPEVGTCAYSFGCATEVVVRGTRGRTAKVTGVEVSTRLTITIWTPQDGPPKVLAHEEGHREICEIYYAPAESIARELAKREIGRTLSVSVRDTAAAEAELKRIQNNLIAEFMRETAARCDFAQARFDAITQHSMDPIAESSAIVRAVAEEAAAYAKSRGLVRQEMSSTPSRTRHAPARPRP
ncbi:MAG TPA: hypothetical protein VL069_10045, partial [Opitutus sp.]|nr:hypothetical protein [Opitutus sp.]